MFASRVTSEERGVNVVGGNDTGVEGSDTEMICTGRGKVDNMGARESLRVPTAEEKERNGTFPSPKRNGYRKW